MTIDKMFDGSIYELHTWNSTWKAKSCGQTDRTPQKITSRCSSFHPCEEPDQRRMLIVCDNFKGKEDFVVQENKRNVYPWETNIFSDQPVCCYLSSHVTYRPQIIKSNCIDMCMYFILFFDFRFSFECLTTWFLKSQSWTASWPFWLTIFIFLTLCKSSMSLRYFLPLHSALIACIFLAAEK